MDRTTSVDMTVDAELDMAIVRSKKRALDLGGNMSSIVICFVLEVGW